MGFVSFGVVLDKDCQSLVSSILRCKPARALWEEKYKRNLEQGWCDLKDTGQAPAPIALYT